MPLSPQANWSRLVLPFKLAPTWSRRETTVACLVGVYANGAQAAVVGRPDTSMLSLTAKLKPASVPFCSFRKNGLSWVIQAESLAFKSASWG